MVDYDGLKLILREIRLDIPKLKVQLRIGMPSGLQVAMYGVSNMVIQTAVNTFGTDYVAAWAAYGKLDAIFWAICGAFGVAITTFAGQNYGAGKLDRVFKSMKVCTGMAVLACGSIMVLLMVFCRPLFAIFCEDTGVVDIGVYMLTTMMPSYILFVFIEIYSGTLRGLSDVFVPAIITMSGVLFVRVPMMVFVIPAIPDFMVILMSYPISWAVTLALFVPYFSWRKKKILRQLAG